MDYSYTISLIESEIKKQIKIRDNAGEMYQIMKEMHGENNEDVLKIFNIAQDKLIEYTNVLNKLKNK